MVTVIKINPKNPEPEKIAKAAELIKAGGIVAFPTETVYGVGTNAFDEEAVKKIYEIKNRPKNKPLPILLAESSQVKSVVAKISRKAEELMKKFWPGPLTIVFEKSIKVPNIISAGLHTVGVRIPDHKVIQELIKASGVPIVATSANKSGEQAPKDAQEVEKSLKEIDLILDGGKTELGIPSTVVDATKEPPEVLREGSIKIK